MQIRHVVRCLTLITPLLGAGCAGESGTPSTPSAPTPAPTAVVAEAPLSLQSITVVPDGAGVQYNTDFQFTAAGTFPSGTQFVWRFGDGSSTTTSAPTVGRIYGAPGVFGVTLEARSGDRSAAASKAVSVRSLLGRWVGTVTGFTHFPLQRPVPMTAFELYVSGMTVEGNTIRLAGRWADSAGCRETRDTHLRQSLRPEASATVTFGVNSLSCADGDFYLTGVADARFDSVSGHCDVMGGNPNCRFQMVRD